MVSYLCSLRLSRHGTLGPFITGTLSPVGHAHCNYTEFISLACDIYSTPKIQSFKQMMKLYQEKAGKKGRRVERNWVYRTLASTESSFVITNCHYSSKSTLSFVSVIRDGRFISEGAGF